MPIDPPSLTLSNVGYAFDHPEAVAWGPDGRAYAGGEAGQLYRFSLDGKTIEEVARVQGGFLLGMAHDADANTYACDERSACVHRITPSGDVSTYCQRQRRAEDARAELSGVRRPRQSLRLGFRRMGQRKDGFIWKIAPGGAAEIWDRQANGFTNGMCLSADGKWLYVAESSPPLISRVEIKADGSAGRREVVVELPRQVPDGLAFDAARRPLHQPLQSQHHLPAHHRRGVADALRRLGTTDAGRADQHRLRRPRPEDADHRLASAAGPSTPRPCRWPGCRCAIRSSEPLRSPDSRRRPAASPR